MKFFTRQYFYCRGKAKQDKIDVRKIIRLKNYPAENFRG